MQVTLDHQPSSFTANCDALVAEVLDQAGLYAPPVDALVVARALGIEVLYDAQQAGRARFKRFAGEPLILLRPDDRPERQQWAVAHEIGESLCHRLLPAMDDAVPLVGRDAPRERAANEFASRLLLPSDWFLLDAAECDGDLFALKSRYESASHELILTNMLRLAELTLVTVFDHGRVTRRRGNGQLAPPPLLPLERRVRDEVHHARQPCERVESGVRVQGWPVHEPGWPRELLRCTPTEEIDESC